MHYQENSDCRLKLHLIDLKHVCMDAEKNYLEKEFADYVLIELSGDSETITIMHPKMYLPKARIKYI